MLTRKIDRGLDALLDCQLRLPDLADCYQPNSPERAAIEAVLEAVRKADETLFRQKASPPRAWDGTRHVRNA